MEMIELGKRARAASQILGRATTQQKNDVLTALAERLEKEQETILAENERDVNDAKNVGLAPSLVDRLLLTPARLAGMAADLRQVVKLPDPVGEIFDETLLPSGLKLSKRRVPIGVLGVIYEARPNVTIDIAGLGIKTGNACVLRGGKETLRSNLALVKVIHKALTEVGLSEDSVLYIDDIDRARVAELLHMDQYVDMIIPRGGAGLHKFCRENSRVPVITGGIGICHIFVDDSADLDASLEVIHNAKTQRPSVCNALDTVLVHRSIAGEFLPRIVTRLEPDGVSFRVHENALPYLQKNGSLPEGVQLAGPADFDTEWMALILGLKVVDNLSEAIYHINAHSQGHSDSILTAEQTHADRFVGEVDSAAVYVNASTRFTDGGQFGLGAEVAISTQRLHARGPMGLRELTTYKWVGLGEYLIRK